MKKIIATILCIVLSAGCLTGCSLFDKNFNLTKEAKDIIKAGGEVVETAVEVSVIEEIEEKIDELSKAIGLSKNKENELSKEVVGVKNWLYSVDTKTKQIEDANNEIKESNKKLGEGLDKEVKDREEADLELKDGIEDEVMAREEGDTALGIRIDDETTAREAADKWLFDIIKILKEIVDTGFSTIESEVTALTTRVDKAEVDIATNVTDISTIKGNISDLSTDSSKFYAGIAENKASITEIQAKLSEIANINIQSRLETLENELDDLENKGVGTVTADLQAQIDALKARVDKLENPGT